MGGEFQAAREQRPGFEIVDRRTTQAGLNADFSESKDAGGRSDAMRGFHDDLAVIAAGRGHFVTRSMIHKFHTIVVLSFDTISSETSTMRCVLPVL